MNTSFDLIRNLNESARIIRESDEEPIVVEFWETESDRDNGFGEMHKYFPEDKAKEAIKEGKHIMKLMSYASVEVWNTKTGKSYYWTDGVDEKYFGEFAYLNNKK